MKKTLIFLFMLSFLGAVAQESINASGGNASGSGGSVSYSVGQIVYQTYHGINGYESKGVQQPFEISSATATEDITYATICEGVIFSWRGNDYSATGIYYDSVFLINPPVCDSVYILNLTVNPSYNFADEVIIYDYQLPYYWQGNHYYDPLAGTYVGSFLWSAGTYYDTLQTVIGCDSIFGLTLTVLSSGEIWVNRNIGTAVMANWSAVPGATKYGLRIAPEGTTNFISYSTNGNSKRVTGLQPATNYTIQMRYFDGSVWSSWDYYQPLTFETEEVDIYFTRNIGTRAIVEWDELPDVSSYVLQYKKSGSPLWILRGNFAANDLVVMNDLEENTEYQFRLIPRYAGISFWWTDVKTMTTLNTGYQVTKDIGTKLQVEWPPIAGASAYVIQYKKTTDAIWKSTVQNNSTTAILNNLSSGNEYQFRMNVYYDGFPWGQTTPKFYNTNLISIVPSGYDGAQASFSWDAVTNPDASAYYLQTREQGTNTWVSKYTTTNSATVTGLDPLKTYEYRLTVRYGIPQVSWGATEVYPLTGAKNLLALMQTTINVYPNPVTDNLMITVNSADNATHFWNLYDVNGRIVMSGEQALGTGLNILQIDLDKLSSGMYMLHSGINGLVETQRIIKQ